MMKKKSILFFVTEDWYFISHRIKLAIFLKKKDILFMYVVKILANLKLLQMKE